MALTEFLTTDRALASVFNDKVVTPANAEFAKLKKFQNAGGTGTAITLTGVELTDGFNLTFIATANNSAAATTINGKPLYKPGTTTAPNVKSGKAITVWYNLAGDCFFLKASAEGSAVVGDVLAGKTFSNDDDAGLMGTMENRGAVTITPSATQQAIAAGYHNGSGVVSAIPNTHRRWASGIKNHPNGASIFTVSGLTFTPKTVILMGESTYYSNTWHSIVVSSEYQDYMDTANSWYHGVTYQNGGNGTITMPFNVVTFNADGFTISSGNLPNCANYQWVALG